MWDAEEPLQHNRSCAVSGSLATPVSYTHLSDDEKPEWTSLEEIERFSKKMLEEEIY